MPPLALSKGRLLVAVGYADDTAADPKPDHEAFPFDGGSAPCPKAVRVQRVKRTNNSFFPTSGVSLRSTWFSYLMTLANWGVL